MQNPYVQRVMDWLYSLGGWEEKQTGTIGPDERLPWGQTTTMGIQQVLARFGSTGIAPIIMGFDPNLAIFFSGIGTLIFFAVTAGRVPSYLGSSFAFIAPVGAVMAGSGGIKEALGGIVAAGLIYTAIGLAVQYVGSDWIDALMPPLVTGTIVAIIGLNLAGAARDMAESSMFLAVTTVAAILFIALFTGGVIGRLPILLGTVFGYLIALFLGGSDAVGRSIGPFDIQGVNVDQIRNAAWFGIPDFVAPSFSWHAISLIAPVAIVLVAENTGHIKAVSVMTGGNLMPWLGRGFIGDGVATTVAGLGGGTGVTTYAENIGVMAVTRVYSTAIFVVAGFMAILLGLCPKFGAIIGTIPAGVLGGVATVLFGLIAATGFRIWTENRVDFSNAANLFIVAVTIIVGTADYTINIGDFAMGGIALGTFGVIILNQLFGGAGPLPAQAPAGGRGSERVRERPAERRDPRRQVPPPMVDDDIYDWDDVQAPPPRARQRQQRPERQQRSAGYDRPARSSRPDNSLRQDQRRPARDDRSRRSQLDDLPDFLDDEPRPRSRR
jgi:uracil-xanthine permease